VPLHWALYCGYETQQFAWAFEVGLRRLFCSTGTCLVAALAVGAVLALHDEAALPKVGYNQATLGPLAFLLKKLRMCCILPRRCMSH
jgi:hypothetical protein